MTQEVLRGTGEACNTSYSTNPSSLPPSFPGSTDTSAAVRQLLPKLLGWLIHLCQWHQAPHGKAQSRGLCQQLPYYPKGGPCGCWFKTSAKKNITENVFICLGKHLLSEI